MEKGNELNEALQGMARAIAATRSLQRRRDITILESIFCTSELDRMEAMMVEMLVMYTQDDAAKESILLESGLGDLMQRIREKETSDEKYVNEWGI